MAFGDVDGDGFRDFLSSSAAADGPGDSQGREYDVYLVFGGPKADLDSIYPVDAGGADIVFYKGGFAIACVDLDSDGYDDMVLAEHEAFVVFGAPRTALRPSYNFNSNSPNFTPPDIHVLGSIRLGGAVVDVLNFPFDLVYRSLVTGDLNGDGYGDVVIGDHAACDPPGTCLSGAANVIFGRPRNQFPLTIDVGLASNLPHPDVVILGDDNEHYPTTLAVGDLDGDGTDDLLASTIRGWGENNTSSGIGEVHGWWGKSAWRAVYDTQIDDFDFSLQGTVGFIGYTLGYRIATGDMDGDGRDDLVIGSAPGYAEALPPDRTNMGEYRILFGRARTLWPKWGSAVEMTDVLILGAETSDAFDLNGPQEWGICFSFVTGDRDGDAFDDLLVGAGQLRRPDDNTRPGGAYLLRGRPRSHWDPFIDLRDEYDLVIYGIDHTGSPGYQFDRLGYVTGMGDLDGNGKDEVFIAAPFADGPSNSIPDCGEVYVIYDTDAGTPTSGPARPLLARASLLPNYPNPFNASTTLRLQAPPSSIISLTIYDALGREVARPLVSATMIGDEMECQWDAVDDGGRALPSGVYFVKLRAANESHSRKVLLVH